jgi:transcriptional regulator with XRE-family HTH domain
LFGSRCGDDGKPLSVAEVAAVVNAAAGETLISATYVWQLRTGRRRNPTYRHPIALSRAFGVSPSYFFDAGELERGMMPPEIVAVVRDDEIRETALRCLRLSASARRAARTVIDSLLAFERAALPPEVAAALGNDEVREIALRAAGLSERSLRAIRGMIDHARALEHAGS